MDGARTAWSLERHKTLAVTHYLALPAAAGEQPPQCIAVRFLLHADRFTNGERLRHGAAGGTRFAAWSYMPKSKQPNEPAKRSTWPTDDEVRELEGDEVLSDDGRKLQDAERVGAMSPDADADTGDRPLKPIKQPLRD